MTKHPKLHLVQKCLQHISLIVNCGYQQLCKIENGQTVEHAHELFNFGLDCLTEKKFRKLKFSLEAILEYAGHGINGTRPNNYEDDEPFDAYEEILYQFKYSSVDLIELDEHLRLSMSNIAKINQSMTAGFKQFFGNFSHSKMVEGVIIPMTEEEVSEADDQRYFSDIELSAQELSWTEDLKRIKELADNRGSFEEIISLI